MLLPALIRAKDAAHSTSCKNNLRQMMYAMQMYVDDNQGKYPYYLGSPGPSYGDATSPSFMGSNYAYWSSKLFPYHPLNWTNTAFHCPGYKGPITGGSVVGAFNGMMAYGILRCGSYAYNANGGAVVSNIRGSGSNLHFLGLDPGGIPAPGALSAAISETQVQSPSEMIAMSDSYNANVIVGVGQTEWISADLGSGLGIGISGVITFGVNPAWHGKNYNQVYCDGHVGAMPPSVLFNPTNTATLWNRDHQPHPEYWQ
jgi:prepilin-type processing-associated H-X9-DG protein